MDASRYELIFLLATALSIGLLMMPVAATLCQALGWVDHPDARKLHQGRIPLAGGVALLVTTALALVVTGFPVAAMHVPLACALIVFVAGFADDRAALRARYRLIAQLLAAVMFLFFADLSLDSLGALLGPFELSIGVMTAGVVLIGIAGATNAVNMMDGLDGLAGGLAVSMLISLGVAFSLVGINAGASSTVISNAHAALGICVALVGGLLAFLLFNQRAPWRRHASMFLGDGGSMTLGFLIAALCVYAAFGFGQAGMPPVVAAWIMAIPLIDLFGCVFRRMLEGVTPMTPDRRHLHHLLLAKNLPTAWAVFGLQMAALALGLAGLALWRLRVPEYLMFWSLVALFATYFLYARREWARQDRRDTPVDRPIVAAPELSAAHGARDGRVRRALKLRQSG